jgi:polysaccharide export outer membrane protein
MATGCAPVTAVTGAAVEAAVADLPGDGYIIGAGDVLHVSVWKEEALTRTVTVLPDGMISFPLIGQVKAEGKSLASLKGELETQLSRYVPDVVLSLEVAQVNSMLVYVIGHVRSPGRVVLNANVDVLQALAMVGGLDSFARESKIQIFRKEGERTVVLPFRYDDLIDGSHLEANVRLQRGDVIVVP